MERRVGPGRIRRARAGERGGGVLALTGAVPDPGGAGDERRDDEQEQGDEGDENGTREAGRPVHGQQGAGTGCPVVTNGRGAARVRASARSIRGSGGTRR